MRARGYPHGRSHQPRSPADPFRLAVQAQRAEHQPDLARPDEVRQDRIVGEGAREDVGRLRGRDPLDH